MAGWGGGTGAGGSQIGDDRGQGSSSNNGGNGGRSRNRNRDRDRNRAPSGRDAFTPTQAQIDQSRTAHEGQTVGYRGGFNRGTPYSPEQGRFLSRYEYDSASYLQSHPGALGVQTRASPAGRALDRQARTSALTTNRFGGRFARAAGQALGGVVESGLSSIGRGYGRQAHLDALTPQGQAAQEEAFLGLFGLGTALNLGQAALTAANPIAGLAVAGGRALYGAADRLANFVGIGDLPDIPSGFTPSPTGIVGAFSDVASAGADAGALQRELATRGDIPQPVDAVRARAVETARRTRAAAIARDNAISVGYQAQQARLEGQTRRDDFLGRQDIYGYATPTRGRFGISREKTAAQSFRADSARQRQAALISSSRVALDFQPSFISGDAELGLPVGIQTELSPPPSAVRAGTPPAVAAPTTAQTQIENRRAQIRANEFVSAQRDIDRRDNPVIADPRNVTIGRNPQTDLEDALASYFPGGGAPAALHSESTTGKVIGGISEGAILAGTVLSGVGPAYHGIKYGVKGLQGVLAARQIPAGQRVFTQAGQVPPATTTGGRLGVAKQEVAPSPAAYRAAFAKQEQTFHGTQVVTAVTGGGVLSAQKTGGRRSGSPAAPGTQGSLRANTSGRFSASGRIQQSALTAPAIAGAGEVIGGVVDTPQQEFTPAPAPDFTSSPVTEFNPSPPPSPAAPAVRSASPANQPAVSAPSPQSVSPQAVGGIPTSKSLPAPSGRAGIRSQPSVSLSPPVRARTPALSPARTALRQPNTAGGGFGRANYRFASANIGVGRFGNIQRGSIGEGSDGEELLLFPVVGQLNLPVRAPSQTSAQTSGRAGIKFVRQSTVAPRVVNPRFGYGRFQSGPARAV